MLAQRLVHRMSVSNDAEASMISKLRLACGFEYTTKLQRMYQDIGISQNLSESFKEHVINELADVDFSILVLSSGWWSLQQPEFDFSLPSELERSVDRFTAHYSAKYSNRKLHWLYNLSEGELVTNCFTNKFTLQVSMYQMAYRVANRPVFYRPNRYFNKNSMTGNYFLPALPRAGIFVRCSPVATIVGSNIN